MLDKIILLKKIRFFMLDTIMLKADSMVVRILDISEDIWDKFIKIL